MTVALWEQSGAPIHRHGRAVGARRSEAVVAAPRRLAHASGFGAIETVEINT